MTVKYKLVNWEFDSVKLAEVLQTLSKDDLEVIRGVMDVSEGAIWHWRNNSHTGEFRYPTMTNFLLLCNWLDLDPRDFFKLEN